MGNKIFFGIRTNLITETQEALKREAERKRKKAQKKSAEKMAKKTAEEMAEEEAEKEAEKRDKEILSFLEAFKKQDNILDLVVYTGIINSVNVLISEPFLPLPAGVSYDSGTIQFLAPKKRSEIEEKMRKAKDVQLFSSKEEAIKAMTSI